MAEWDGGLAEEGEEAVEGMEWMRGMLGVVSIGEWPGERWEVGGDMSSCGGRAELLCGWAGECLIGRRSAGGEASVMVLLLLAW